MGNCSCSFDILCASDVLVFEAATERNGTVCCLLECTDVLKYLNIYLFKIFVPWLECPSKNNKRVSGEDFVSCSRKGCVKILSILVFIFLSPHLLSFSPFVSPCCGFCTAIFIHCHSIQQYFQYFPPF